MDDTMKKSKNAVVRGTLPLLLGFLPLTSMQAQVEKDTTMNRTVVVENEYNPDILDASKINALPLLEAPSTAQRGADYATGDHVTAGGDWQSMPALMRKWKQGKAPRGYARAGYGNKGNVDVRLGYVWDLSADDRLKIAGSWNGWNGELKSSFGGADWDSRFYRTQVGVDYSHLFPVLKLDLGGHFASQTFNYMPLTIDNNQTHTLGDFVVGLSSRDASLPLQFRAKAGFQHFGIKHPLSFIEEDGSQPVSLEMGDESKLFLGGDVWGQVTDEQRVGIAFQLDHLSYSDAQVANDRTSLCANPYYQWQNDNWKVRLGAHVDYVSGDFDGFDVAPDVKVEYVFADSYVFYAHALGGRELNDYRSLNAKSPYWLGIVPDTYVKVNATLGLKASPMDGLWFHLFGGYRDSQDECFSSLSSAFTVFAVDDAQKTYTGAEVKYGYKDLFDLTVKGVYSKWEGENSGNSGWLEALKPKFEFSMRADGQVFPGLNIYGGYEYVKRTLSSIDPVSNLYVGADFEFLPRLSVFGTVNNLLNKQYVYESAYPAQKFNFLAGFSYEF
ncbi:TonB-dependent receptor [gut metagenome]|uniref:TonB-dependent receptor n=1 Tax=gut metagenome TaxID=749906 RepID=J9GC09_9ZZZZ